MQTTKRLFTIEPSVSNRFGDRLRRTVPEGGMFTWATFEDASIDTDALLPRAVEAGVAYVPGRCFAVGGDLRSSLRLSFATATPDELTDAVDRLAGVIPSA